MPSYLKIEYTKCSAVIRVYYVGKINVLINMFAVNTDDIYRRGGAPAKKDTKKCRKDKT